jgi:hypothetical protein
VLSVDKAGYQGDLVIGEKRIPQRTRIKNGLEAIKKY